MFKSWFIVIPLLAASCAMSVSGGTDRQSAVPQLTVCQALANASKFDGKIVQIKGAVAATEEGAWFVGEECPGIFTAGGKKWPSEIAWTSPTDLNFIIHPIDFVFDRGSRKRIDDKWKELRRRLPDRCIAVTYTGMFERWSKGGARKRDPKGRFYEFSGFGHLNAAPAQLVLKSADDVTAIPNCKGKK